MLLLGTPAVACLLDRFRELSRPWRIVLGAALLLVGFTIFDLVGRTHERLRRPDGAHQRRGDRVRRGPRPPPRARARMTRRHGRDRARRARGAGRAAVPGHPPDARSHGLRGLPHGRRARCCTPSRSTAPKTATSSSSTCRRSRSAWCRLRSSARNRAKAAWFAVSFALLVAFVAGSIRALPDRRRALGPLVALTLVIIARVAIRELSLGQTNVLLGALLAASFRATTRGARGLAGDARRPRDVRETVRDSAGALARRDRGRRRPRGGDRGDRGRTRASRAGLRLERQPRSACRVVPHRHRDHRAQHAAPGEHLDRLDVGQVDRRRAVGGGAGRRDRARSHRAWRPSCSRDASACPRRPIWSSRCCCS